MAALDRPPPPPIVEDFPPSRPGWKFLGIVMVIVAAIVILVFRQQVMAAIGMG